MDVDFRHSGTAPFTPASSTGVKEEELEALDEGQRREKLAGPELLKRKQEGLQRELEDELSNGGDFRTCRPPGVGCCCCC